MTRDLVARLLCSAVAAVTMTSAILLKRCDDTPARQSEVLVCKCPQQAPGRACDCEDPFGEGAK